MGDANLHNHRRCPLVVFGGGSGQLTGDSPHQGSGRNSHGERHADASPQARTTTWRASATARAISISRPPEKPMKYLLALVLAATARCRRRQARRSGLRAQPPPRGRRCERLAWRRNVGAPLGVFRGRRGDGGDPGRGGSEREIGDAHRPLHAAAPGLPRRQRRGRGNPARRGGRRERADASRAATTPLHLAAASGSAETVKLLLARGADVNAREAEWGQTPLIFAASQNRADAIRVLLENDADPGMTTTVLDLKEEVKLMDAASDREQKVLASFRVKVKTEGQEPSPPTATQLQAAIVASRELYLSGEIPENEGNPDDERRRFRENLRARFQGRAHRPSSRRAARLRRSGARASRRRRRRQPGQRGRRHEPAPDGDRERPVRSRARSCSSAERIQISLRNRMGRHRSSRR